MPTKILSVIIPYYTETPGELLLPLANIAGQAGVDLKKIECVLVNDGNHNKMPEEFLSLFKPLTVRCIYMDKNKGPGGARQTGIDNALGEYVLFCDADDTLHDMLVLKTFLDEIEKNHPDIVYTSIIIEKLDQSTNKLIHPVHERMLHLMHGKAYRRKYLQDKDIRFHKTLRIYEDTYFNGLAFSCTENILNAQITSYIRKRRLTSITHADDFDYFNEKMPDYVKCIACLLGALEIKAPKWVQEYAVQFCIYFYFAFHQRHWQISGKTDLLNKSEQSFADLIGPYLSYFEKAPEDVIISMYDKLYPSYFTGEVATETVREWIKRMRNQSTISLSIK